MMDIYEFAVYMALACAGVAIFSYFVCKMKRIREAIVAAIATLLICVVVVNSSNAEKMSARVAGVDFRNNEVYAITRTGEIYSWFEEDIDEENVLLDEYGGDDVRLGQKIVLEMCNERIEGRILTGFIWKFETLSLSYDGENIFGYASDPIVAGFIMNKMKNGVASVPGRR